MSSQISDPSSAVLEPHLALDNARGSTRYPNPFFDLGQQYLPRTVKELFRWCTYFYYTDPLVNAAVTKISRYPITEIIVEDSSAKIRDYWGNVLKTVLKLVDNMMDVNLDLNVYGNAFVSLHFPFIRYLVCQQCKHHEDIKNLAWKWSNYKFNFTCLKCGSMQGADPEKTSHVKDVPYKRKELVRIIRWNPENMGVRYNEATGEYVYLYNISRSIKSQIHKGEQEIIERLPLLFINAVRRQRLIRFSNKNIFHLRRPSLAEKDMGWGKPLIQPVLKDLYYLATLRRAQEAIANEHIVPFDFLYPQPNAQMDPFVHSDLGNWRSRVEGMIKKHRRDPNFKAVLPVPIGFGRIGGQGRALLLTPELDHLSKKIVSGMGIPLDFVQGGLNWTGSSVTLRSLQNDFKHNQTQVLELANWITQKMSVFLGQPAPSSIRFMDFKMADDVQKIQQLIGLNAQGKVSNETLLTELGLDFGKETKKIISEMQAQNEIQVDSMKASAKASGESQLVSYEYQSKLQSLQQKDMMEQAAQSPGLQQGQEQGGQDQQMQGQTSEQSQENQAQVGMQAGQMQGDQSGGEGQGEDKTFDVNKKAEEWAGKLAKMDPAESKTTIAQIKVQMPSFGQLVEEAYNTMVSGSQAGRGVGGGGPASQTSPQGAQVNMTPMPQQKAPTRAGAV